jgi:hypothetical protein
MRDVAGSDTEIPKPIDVAVPPILVIEAVFIVPQQRRSAATEI